MTMGKNNYNYNSGGKAGGGNTSSGNRAGGGNKLSGGQKTTSTSGGAKYSTASYNFVPLPLAVVPAPLAEAQGKTAEDKYSQYVLAEGSYTGYLDLEIMAKTPLFIGSKAQDPEFFSIDGKPTIPGSSLRGMIRSVFQLLTWSGVSTASDDADIENKRLYYRAVAGGIKQRDYRDELYQNSGKYDRQGKPIWKSRYAAGFILKFKGDDSYYYSPAEFKVEKNKALVDKYSKYNGKIGYTRWRGEKGGLEVDCFSGPMGRKEHYTVHKSPKWDDLRIIEQVAIDEYNGDLTRNEDLDLLKDKSHLAKRGEEAAKITGLSNCILVAPCFYVEDRGRIKHFGFNRNYRVPYKKTVGEHLGKIAYSNGSAKSMAIDFTKAVFGNKESWASRIMVEDAVITTGGETERQDWLEPLLGPKPTSVQLYLEQQGEGKATNTWNSTAKIRGFKFYWHQKDGARWQIKNRDMASEKITEEIAPIAAGAVFRTRLHFKRLSKIELGALLKVFSLGKSGEDICFKLGKGRSLGLGSVKIVPTLHLLLSPETNSYQTIFAADGSFTKPEAIPQDSWQEYLAAFEDYLKGKLTDGEQAAYKSMQRDLELMLDFKNTENRSWAAETRTMSIEKKLSRDGQVGFTDGFSLLTPKKVVEQSKS